MSQDASSPTDDAKPAPASPATLSHSWPLITLGVLLAVLILWAAPQWQIKSLNLSPKEALLTANTLRDTWAHILSTFFLLLAAYFTWRYMIAMGQTVASSERTTAAAEKNAAISAERHITERFVRVMELLGDDKLEVRLGGVYALERIARDSPTDQNAVTEVLATYIREHAPWRPEQTQSHRVRADVQAILTVLSRRTWAGGNEETLDLHETSLAASYLPFARFSQAYLYETNLRGAMLYHADLRGAWLWKAHLHDAVLEDAHLEGADLTAAEGLTWEQLQQAHIDKTTKLPDYLRATMPEDAFAPRTGSTPDPINAPPKPEPFGVSTADQKLPSKR